MSIAILSIVLLFMFNLYLALIRQKDFLNGGLIMSFLIAVLFMMGMIIWTS